MIRELIISKSQQARTGVKIRQLINSNTQQEILAWCKNKAAHQQKITTGKFGMV
jgi:hypothetical protein